MRTCAAWSRGATCGIALPFCTRSSPWIGTTDDARTGARGQTAWRRLDTMMRCVSDEVPDDLHRRLQPPKQPVQDPARWRALRAWIQRPELALVSSGGTAEGGQDQSRRDDQGGHLRGDSW